MVCVNRTGQNVSTYFICFITATEAPSSVCSCDMQPYVPLSVCFTTGNAATSVTATVVPASVVSMAFFNKLTEDDHIVRASGHIKKCLDEFIGDFVISDELRQVGSSYEVTVVV